MRGVGFILNLASGVAYFSGSLTSETLKSEKDLGLSSEPSLSSSQIIPQMLSWEAETIL